MSQPSFLSYQVGNAFPWHPTVFSECVFWLVGEKIGHRRLGLEKPDLQSSWGKTTDLRSLWINTCLDESSWGMKDTLKLVQINFPQRSSWLFSALMHFLTKFTSLTTISPSDEQVRWQNDEMRWETPKEMDQLVWSSPLGDYECFFCLKWSSPGIDRE